MERRPDAAASPATLASTSATVPRQRILAECYATLDRMRGARGLYLASPSADYSKVWIRDNVYEVLPYADKPSSRYEETFHGLLDVLRRHEWKVDAIVRSKPSHRDDYIHARFHVETLREIDEPWGNKQNDATGALLWGIARGLARGRRILRDDRDRRLVEKLVGMHVALRYWEDPDNGMWEEGEELHASSVGAALAGLRAIRDAGFRVPADAIAAGERALDALLPAESTTKEVDLALLSLVWPYRVASPAQRAAILQRVERRLLRERGVIRYEGDSYYSRRAERHGRGHPPVFYHGDEAEWTFGLPWLSLCYREAGWSARADHFLERALRVMDAPGSLPELYYARTAEPGPNTPLGWSVAMLILALEAAPAAGAAAGSESEK